MEGKAADQDKQRAQLSNALVHTLTGKPPARNPSPLYASCNLSIAGCYDYLSSIRRSIKYIENMHPFPHSVLDKNVDESLKTVIKQLQDLDNYLHVHVCSISLPQDLLKHFDQ